MVDQERRTARLVVGLVLCGVLTVVLIANPVADLLGWRIFMFADPKLQAVWAGGALLAFGLTSWPFLRWVTLIASLFYMENLYQLLVGHGAVYFVTLGVSLTGTLAGGLLMGGRSGQSPSS